MQLDGKQMEKGKRGPTASSHVPMTIAYESYKTVDPLPCGIVLGLHLAFINDDFYQTKNFYYVKKINNIAQISCITSPLTI